MGFSKNQLPEEFVQRMKKLLSQEWEQLLTVWDEAPYLGLRINTLKISVDDFLQKTPFSLAAIPWTGDGFYYSGDNRPAKHPYYQAGMYYLQEPSAMAPAACLNVKPGEKVLDLCAAPGGKSTQIAAALRGEGLLVSNDISSDRVKALVWNLEHWGSSNVVVTNDEPQKLAACFENYFDKILIDAPCSGEGMFRKDSKALKSWSAYNSDVCTAMQSDILHWAAKMLKNGGKLLYSTCTFSPEENELIIEEFIHNHQEFSICQLPLYQGWQQGFSDKISAGQQVENTRRLFPHKVKGEGHFLALLVKKTEGVEKSVVYENKEGEKIEPLLEFMEENLTSNIDGAFFQKGKYIYRKPNDLPELRGIKVVRPGWFVGILKNKRFEPSQALAMALKKENVKRIESFSLEDERVRRYLKGETIMLKGDKGWTLICIEDYPLGWAKQTGDFLKNYYPPGWRNEF